MSIADFCTVTASTKRNADLGSGRTGATATNLSSLLITPLWPLDRDIITQLDINSPREYKQCFHVPATGAALPDVVEGDVLTVASADYRVYYVGEWESNSLACLRILVQEVKGT